ncbi:MAG: hypothetical protein ABSH05_15725 [Bryobacteraceae bacterium]|jgi:hypothetical protein
MKRVKSEGRVTAAMWRWCAAAGLSIVLLPFAHMGQAFGQAMQAQVREVMVTSEPPGASIWTKEGRDYKCSSSVTPTRFELTFYGSNAVKQLLLTRFGYSSRKLTVGAADERAGADLAPIKLLGVLGASTSPEVQKMRVGFADEFERALVASGDALRCAPLEISQIGVVQNEAAHEMELFVMINLNESGVWRDLRLATRRTTDREPERKIAQAALEGGVADVLALFGSVMTRFPEVPRLVVSCMYTASAPVIQTERRRGMHTEYVYRYDSRTGTMQPTPKQVYDTIETDVVNEETKPQTLFLSISAAKIPALGGRKAVTDAFLASGEIKRVP